MSLAATFAQTGFARFINSPAGRVARFVAGLALLLWGYTQRASTAGIVLMVVGLVPLVAGGLDLCLISALLGGPIRGSALRKPRQPPAPLWALPNQRLKLSARGGRLLR